MGCGEFQLLDEVHGAVDGEGAKSGNRHAVDQHGEALWPEPSPLAGRTGRRLQHTGQFREAVSVPGDQFHRREDAPELEGQAGHPLVVHPPFASVEQHLELFRRQGVDRRLEGKSMRGRHLFQQVDHGPLAHGAFSRRAFSPDRRHRFTHRFRAMGYQQVQVDAGLGAESLAFGAHARPVIEGKALWRGFVVAVSAGRTRIVSAETDVAGLGGIRLLHLGDQQPTRKFQGRLHRVGQALAHVAPHDDTVHHHAQLVAPATVDLYVLFETPQFAVDAHPDEPVPAGPVQEDVIPLCAFGFQRGVERGARPFRQGHDAVHDLAGCLRADGHPAGRTVGDAHEGVKPAQVLVDLGDGAHRGPGVPARGLLFDGYGGGQADDVVHLRFLHLLQELPRIGGQGFHVPPLAFRVDRIEGQGGFPRTRYPREYRHPVPGDRHGEIVQIVFPRTAHGDLPDVTVRARGLTIRARGPVRTGGPICDRSLTVCARGPVCTGGRR